MPTPERVIATALRRYSRIPGHTRADLEQTAWLALLEAQQIYDPLQHRCTQRSFIVMQIRKRISRLCAKALRSRVSTLPTQLVARDHTPLDEVIFNEEVRRVRKCSSQARGL